MGSNIQVPSNIDNPVVLRRFMLDFVNNYNSNPLNGTKAEQIELISSIMSNNTTLSILNNNSELKELRSTIKSILEEDLTTNILKNSKDIASITEQYNAFTDSALAASWYGLSVKAGGAIAGLEIGSLDPGVTTPGDESSYFRVIADNFIVGRAYEDLSQEEKDYLSTNGLPNFGTVYDVNNLPVPALAISWDSISNTYKHFFNGVVSFNNINTGHSDANGNTLIDGGSIVTDSISAEKINVTTLSALTANLGTVYAGIIYDSTFNTSGGLNYKMRIDLDNGRIYIR